MVVLTAETCWALNEYWIYNKISGIKLVSLYSTISVFLTVYRLLLLLGGSIVVLFVLHLRVELREKEVVWRQKYFFSEQQREKRGNLFQGIIKKYWSLVGDSDTMRSSLLASILIHIVQYLLGVSLCCLKGGTLLRTRNFISGSSNMAANTLRHNNITLGL